MTTKQISSLKKAWAGRKIQAALARSSRETKRIAKQESARQARAAWSAQARERRQASIVLSGLC